MPSKNFRVWLNKMLLSKREYLQKFYKVGSKWGENGEKLKEGSIPCKCLLCNYQVLIGNDFKLFVDHQINMHNIQSSLPFNIDDDQNAKQQFEKQRENNKIKKSSNDAQYAADIISYQETKKQVVKERLKIDIEQIENQKKQLYGQQDSELTIQSLCSQVLIQQEQIQKLQKDVELLKSAVIFAANKVKGQ